MFYQFKTAVSINKFILYTLILKKLCKAFGCFYIAASLILLIVQLSGFTALEKELHLGINCVRTEHRNFPAEDIRCCHLTAEQSVCEWC